ncbi:MAG: carboxypeptidase [Roseofilum sp. SBFL]|uniref:M14 family zinc carboxypeptidase n=1 Tax=unclassified Roseofilum TaxID=2620099 RepID=UPI001B1C6628|nr:MULTISPECIES: M14 family zinc carboxypeptidase [unclassified Roseofilum]MBP0015239.1 carboxypeptidase [Roseofilum sp. SID3]MBP0023603.1 carboxypeptidase [Roseofilum sp. SID2]MBP0039264.1 carboxypeptidase [Roseofilum sp. SID1]MBP0042726.1 carboxypeptidase [Roseofilum sp. SBFL]
MTIPAFDFSHYFPYQELTDYLTQMAQAYPNLMQLKSLGTTDEGREIWLATVTDQTTGAALEKPGYWIDANTHAAEVTGSAVACYILYQVLTQYNQDAQITHLLQNYTLYILPRIAVDGAEKYLQTPYNLRSSTRLYPESEQQDGLYPEDINGDDHLPTEDLRIYQLIGKKGSELTKYKCVSVYHDFRYDPKTVVYGAMDDYGYDHWGWFGFTVELWDAAKEAGVEKQNNIEWGREHPIEDDLKILQWNDEYLEGKGFIPWQGFEHPQLGEVEIGGWDMKRMWKNAPAKALPEICDRHFKFAIAHALMSPRLSVARSEVSHEGADIYRITVQWENLGFLPTHTSKKALERQAVRPTRVKLGLPEGVTLISGEQEQEIDPLEGRSNKWFNASANGTDYRTHRSWVVKGKAGSEVRVEAIAERAGTVRTSVILS